MTPDPTKKRSSPWINRSRAQAQADRRAAGNARPAIHPRDFPQAREGGSRNAQNNRPAYGDNRDGRSRGQNTPNQLNERANRREGNERQNGGRERQPNNIGSSATTARPRNRDISSTQDDSARVHASNKARDSPSAKQQLVLANDVATLFDLPAGRDSSTTSVRHMTSLTLLSAPASRAQDHLERYGGDYSRYLKHSKLRDGTPLDAQGPLGCAYLALARRPEITLDKRGKALGMIDRVLHVGQSQTSTIRV